MRATDSGLALTNFLISFKITYMVAVIVTPKSTIPSFPKASNSCPDISLSPNMIITDLGMPFKQFNHATTSLQFHSLIYLYSPS